MGKNKRTHSQSNASESFGNSSKRHCFRSSHNFSTRRQSIASSILRAKSYSYRRTRPPICKNYFFHRSRWDSFIRQKLRGHRSWSATSRDTYYLCHSCQKRKNRRNYSRSKRTLKAFNYCKKMYFKRGQVSCWYPTRIYIHRIGMRLRWKQPKSWSFPPKTIYELKVCEQEMFMKRMQNTRDWCITQHHLKALEVPEIPDLVQHGLKYYMWPPCESVGRHAYHYDDMNARSPWDEISYDWIVNAYKVFGPKNPLYPTTVHPWDENMNDTYSFNSYAYENQIRFRLKQHDIVLCARCQANYKYGKDSKEKKVPAVYSCSNQNQSEYIRILQDEHKTHAQDFDVYKTVWPWEDSPVKSNCKF